MAHGVNKVTLLGNLGRDPDIRYTNNGTAVANLSVATNERYKPSGSDTWTTRVEWHKVVFFNQVADICADHLHKGSRIYVEGSLRTRKWENNEGQTRSSTEIIGRELIMLDPPAEQPESHPQSQGPSAADTAGVAYQDQHGAAPDDDFEDDIPF